VSFRAKEAVIAFDPEQVTVEQMVDAVTRTGFHASVKTQSSAPPPAGRRGAGDDDDVAARGGPGHHHAPRWVDVAIS